MTRHPDPAILAEAMRRAGPHPIKYRGGEQSGSGSFVRDHDLEAERVVAVYRAIVKERRKR